MPEITRLVSGRARSQTQAICRACALNKGTEFTESRYGECSSLTYFEVRKVVQGPCYELNCVPPKMEGEALIRSTLDSTSASPANCSPTEPESHTASPHGHTAGESPSALKTGAGGPVHGHTAPGWAHRAQQPPLCPKEQALPQQTGSLAALGKETASG